ncbi:hypothetical protein [Actinoplanes sp. NPDC049265]|uniref:hypothetical protein n=1 Tax=Actinoplanes sp. NPDC049265 TaxID=3363902 RepID=UPI003714EF38
MRSALAVIVAAFALSACGSPGQGPRADPPRVATLQSASAGPAKAADVENQRPLIRADTTSDEINEWLEIYTSCLHEQGVPGVDTGHGTWKPTVDEESGKYRAAYQACHAKEPEPAMDRLKRQNFDEYADRYHAFVTCIQNAGVDVAPVEDGPRIKFKKDGDAFSDRVTTITENCARKTRFR